MLFVRCRGGISHNPAEAISVEDADLAVRVLLDVLRHIGAANALTRCWLATRSRSSLTATPAAAS